MVFPAPVKNNWCAFLSRGSEMSHRSLATTNNGEVNVMHSSLTALKKPFEWPVVRSQANGAA